MSKRMTKVLSMILTLVMFLSVSTPAFAWGNIGIGEGWDRDIGEDEVRDFDVGVEEGEEEFDYFSTFDEETGINVTVEAPMGALPTLAEVRVEPVDPEAVREAVDSVTEGEREILLAMDISFWLENDEIEPEEPVRVRIAAPELEGRSDLTVVHIPDEEEPESIDLITDENDLKFELGTNEICFESGDFSVYAVIGGSDDALKLTVNFYDGATLLSSQVLVKSQLAKNPLIDPGVPTLEEDQSFEGWCLVENYNASTQRYTIAELNTYLNDTYGSMTTDQTLNVYAMKFDVLYVTYHDQAGAVLRTQSVLKPLNGSATVNINMSYVPFKAGQNYAGWTPDILNKGDYPSYANNPTVYPNGGTASITADIHLYPYVENGAWLSFDNNLDQDADATSASYTSPVFVKAGDNTVAPATPTRTGYDFGGWYTDEHMTTAFTFGGNLPTDTTVYAKWTPKTTTYMVVFWQQSANDAVGTADANKTYDYYKSVERSATTGQTVRINSSNNGTSADNRLGGNSTSSIGEMGYYFTYNSTNSDTGSYTVNGDGSTVLNVYYDRRTITINFMSSDSSSASTLYTRQGLYKSPLTDWPSAGSNYRWYWMSGSSEYSLSIAWNSYMIYGTTDSSTTTTWTLYRKSFTASSPKTTNWIGQDTDGNFTQVLTTGVIGSGSTVYFDSTLFLGFKLYGYNTRYNQTSGSYFTSVTTSGSVDYSSISDSNVYIYYTRNKFDFTYNSNNENVKTESVYFEKNLSDLASYVPTNGPRGCYFDGWYADPGFNTPFDFSVTMPNANVTVYAKWTLMRFRVVLDPTGGDPNVTAGPADAAEADRDPNHVYFVGNQATTFRVNYGELVQGSSINNAIRPGYTLLGWFLDPEFTVPFNFGNPITDSIADMDYATAEASARRGYDPWNGNRPYDDADGEHDDVVGKVMIYARWREDPKGTIGVHIQYDANQYENATTVENAGSFASGTTWDDPYIYADQAQAYAQPASTPEDDSLHFLYWEIWAPTDADHSDITTLAPTGRTFYPGQTFEVHASDAVVTETSAAAGNGLILDPANLSALRSGNTVGTMATETTTVASWDFESDSFPSGWITTDNDGDSYNWFSMYGSDYAEYAHAGLGYIRSNSYNGSSGIALNPDNWIFSNAVTIPATGTTTLSFWIRAQDTSWPGDVVRVYVCTSQTVAGATAVSSDISAPAAYTEQTIDLSAYAGQRVYIAFRHYNCTDLFAVNIDDVTITNTVETEPDSYTVTFQYLNAEGVQVTEEVTVPAGGNATPPALPDVEGKTFIGWDSSYSNVHSDIVVTAVYQDAGGETQETTNYTVYIRAVYGRKDAGSVTHINWYSNTYDGYGNPIADVSDDTTKKTTAELFPGGSIEQNPSRDNAPATFEYENGGAFGEHGYNLVYDNVEIPESVLIPEKPYAIPGYTFKGWARIPTTENIADFNLNEDEIYIKWVEDNAETGAGHYEARYDGNKLSQQYSLVGYWSGADQNTGYQFNQNGTLTVTFNTDAYVAVKEPGGAWYMIEGAYSAGATGTVLKKLSGEKLFVPANTEVTFTLTENKDGTLFLSYAEGAPTSNEEVWVPVTYVAANEEKPYHDMYAVWEGNFQIYHSGVAGGAIETIPINFRGSYNLADRVTALNNQNRADEPDKFLYGGYYLQGGFTAPAEVEGLIPAYDGTNWTWTTAQTENGMSMTPKAGETYYIKEVPADKYLQPYFHYTYKKGDTNPIVTAWLISDIDDAMYKETGFVIVSADKTANVCSQLTVQNKVGGTSVLLKPETIFRSKGVIRGYLSYLEVITDYQQTLLHEGDQVLQYWVTPDGLIVTGIAQRSYAHLQDKSNVKDDIDNVTVPSSIAVFQALSSEP